MINDRFKRFVPLVGEGIFKKTEDTHVMVFGIGGVGSYATEALARSGVGIFTLVDFDDISIHNINRQIHALTTTVGQKKVEVMAERLLDINPSIKINNIAERLTAENIDDFFKKPPDYILDAIDDVPGKVALIKYSKEYHIPIISAMGTGNKLSPEKLQVADIAKTSVCPLCRSVRRKLRELDIFKGVTVVYSEELPLKTSLLEGEKTVPASSCLVPPVAGILMASWVINQIKTTFERE